MTVYVDVLFIVNLYVNYFLILLTEKLAVTRIKFKRRLLGAAVGALSSLYIFIPQKSAILTAAINLGFAIMIVLSAFGLCGKKALIRRVLLFYASSFSFAGIMLGVWLLFKPKGMVVNNSVVYFNISPLLLIISTAVCYLCITVARKFTSRGAGGSDIVYELELSLEGRTVTVSAMLDTGHNMYDAFTNAPVVIAEKSVASALLPQPVCAAISSPDITENGMHPGIRLLPYNYIGGTGLMPAFKVDSLIVRKDKKEQKFSNILVAVSKEKLAASCSALIGRQLTEGID